MSFNLSRHALRRAVAVISAGVVIGALGSVPSATAGPQASASKVKVKQQPARALGAGRYVVVLREPGATRYDGGVAGLQATKVKPGKPFDARTAKVAAYQRHLVRQQDRLASTVGAQVSSRTTLATNAFTANLSAAQAATLASDRDVLMLVKDTAFSLDTWNTPSRLGLESQPGSGTGGVWAAQGGVERAGAGVVVGILDSGIWPESASFAGTKLDRNPNGPFDIYRQGNNIYMQKADGGEFHGFCEPGSKWTANDCNSKIVSARYYPEAFLSSTPPQERLPDEVISTRDGNGHGSHTASTAAGNFGVHATVEGRDFGTISGMAPAAKIAAYKVCFSDNDPNSGDCFTSSSLQAIDDAVADGVDVINYSISGAQATVVDAVELGFLGAAAAGVFVATSAGNSGPAASTVAHNSPWLTTTASATHYNFENTIALGTVPTQRYKGVSIADTAVGPVGIVNAVPSAADMKATNDTALCGPGLLDPARVTGKIVVCARGKFDRVAKSAEVARAGGVGMVLANLTAGSLDADFHSVPTVHVDHTVSPAIIAYAATSGATATIELGDTTGGAPTPIPQITNSSSRGPALASDSDIIKPDISAPGVSVLAAVAPPTNHGRDFDLYSGTSMASPHIAGLAAFMFGVNPNWTPMQVKSAMMTTAYDAMNSNGSPDQNPFSQGAGHVDPKKFFDPGLVVTSTPTEWLGFLEGQGVDIAGVEAMPASALNIPSIAQGQVTARTTIARTFTGLRPGTWTVSTNVPGFAVSTDKSQVVIAKAGDSVKVTYTFERTDAPLGAFSTGFTTLTGPTTVRLPIALRAVSVKAAATVRGTGGTGSVSVPITAGFTGSLAVVPNGLAKATTDIRTLAVGELVDKTVEIGDGVKKARFDLDAVNNSADLDLYVYQLNDAGVPVALAGQSATGSADESVTLVNPAKGKYLVEIDGFAAAPGESSIDMRYDQFLVSVAGLGNLTATPNPVPVTQGAETSFTASWTGLTAGRYLGTFEYDGALAPTYVYVDVP